MNYFRVPFTPEERDSLLRILMRSQEICYSSAELLELATVIGLLSQKNGLPMHTGGTWARVVMQLDRIVATGVGDWLDALAYRGRIEETAERESATARRT